MRAKSVREKIKARVEGSKSIQRRLESISTRLPRRRRRGMKVKKARVK